MKLQFKLLLAISFLISQTLSYVPDLCGGADPIEVCCGGGEYPGNGCCAAVSCLDVLPFPAVDYDNNCAAVLCSSEVLDPQCCNGVDYPNTCLAQCSNAGNLDNCRPGECKGQILPPPEPIDCRVVLCSSEFTDPYCCNGKSVGNMDNVVQCVEGVTDIDQECSPGYCSGDEPVFCPAIFAPVCCNGQTFSNDCHTRGKFGDDVDSVCISGECEDEPVICPAIFAPLCCNGETFSNDCFATAKFGGDVDSICVPGACEDQVACPATFDLVCCFETELFGNRCEAERKYGNLPNFSEVCIGDCAPRSPECDQPANCFVDPCQLATCAYSGAVCVPNYCTDVSYLGTDVGGPCTPIWVDPQNLVVLTSQQCGKPFGFGNILGGFGNYSPVCCDERTYFNIGRAESDLGVDAAAEFCVNGACSISIFPSFTSP